MSSSDCDSYAREVRATAGCVILATAAIGTTWAAWAGASIEVSQRGRMFDPSTVSISKGDTLHIVNNDADLLHHAYVESPTFSFDSGEQEPGTSVSIAFIVPGSFQVLCGIHPKMRMTVVVK